MEHLTLGQVAALGLVFGSTAAFGIMGAYAARTAWAITKSGNWPNVFRLAGVRFH